MPGSAAEAHVDRLGAPVGGDPDAVGDVLVAQQRHLDHHDAGSPSPRLPARARRRCPRRPARSRGCRGRPRRCARPCWCPARHWRRPSRPARGGRRRCPSRSRPPAPRAGGHVPGRGEVLPAHHHCSGVPPGASGSWLPKPGRSGPEGTRACTRPTRSSPPDRGAARRSPGASPSPWPRPARAPPRPLAGRRRRPARRAAAAPGWRCASRRSSPGSARCAPPGPGGGRDQQHAPGKEEERARRSPTTRLIPRTGTVASLRT